MTDNNLNEKPRLVNAGQGFSILNTVNYKGRFLYSKYSPDKAINAAVEKLQILPGTLVVICSPCIWYGLDALVQKLADGCEIIAFEADRELYELAQEQILNQKNKSLVKLFSLSEPQKVNEYLLQNTSQGKFKRALRIDFSAGVSLAAGVYDSAFTAVIETINTFWKNRVTLVKMGRLYARNIFRNLCCLGKSCLLDEKAKSVEKPLIVFGAGESTKHTLDILSQKAKEQPDFLNGYYLLATDAALPVFNAYGITPDAVAGLEAQAAIEKAYIGSAGKGITLFTDISSRPQIRDILGGETVFFSTKYAECSFLNGLKDSGIIKSFIPAMGSVGLAAVYIALTLRSDDEVPVFITGLDFSFSTGATHTKGAPAHLARLFSSKRFSAVENYDASFKNGTFCFTGKDSRLTRSDSILSSYAFSFKAIFQNTPSLFDAGCSGLDLGIPAADDDAVTESGNYCTDSSLVLQSASPYAEEPFVTSSTGSWDDGAEETADSETRTLFENRKQLVEEFYRNEFYALTKIKDLLSKGDSSEYRDMSIPLNEQLENLLKKREYLYLHFPDGYRLSTDISFLKRIRAEINFFIKDISFAEKTILLSL